MKTITDNELIDTSRGKKRIGALFDENAMLHANNDALVDALETLLPHAARKIQGTTEGDPILTQARAILEQVKK